MRTAGGVGTAAGGLGGDGQVARVLGRGEETAIKIGQAGGEDGGFAISDMMSLQNRSSQRR